MWLYGEMRQEGETTIRQWKRGWSTAVVTVIVLMLCAGISAVGMVHQAAWLVTLGDPLFNSSGKAARRTQSRNNLQQLGLAMHNYHDTHEALPPGGTFDRLGNGRHGWITMLLPYLDQESLYEQIDFEAA